MKNKFMRIAAVMLMLCLVTTCAISGTFAKYTTENTATDTARVAKWGVTITAPADATANTTFVTTYADNDASFNGNSVVGAADVVAPGTEGTLATPTISGTPEVAVRVTLDATLTLTNWNGTSGEYCPLVFTVDGDTTETFKIGDAGINSVADLKAKVEAAIEKYSQDYAAGTNLANDVQDNIPTVEWAWAFDTAANDGANDANDTALGNAAADADTANDPTIEFSIKVIITQID